MAIENTMYCSLLLIIEGNQQFPAKYVPVKFKAFGVLGQWHVGFLMPRFSNWFGNHTNRWDMHAQQCTTQNLMKKPEHHLQVTTCK